jgi:hypothetical protein
VAKTLVDLPPEKVAAARAALGTGSKRETIERALDLVIQQAQQRALVEAVASGEVSPDFGPESLAQARA